MSISCLRPLLVSYLLLKNVSVQRSSPPSFDIITTFGFLDGFSSGLGYEYVTYLCFYLTSHEIGLFIFYGFNNAGGNSYESDKTSIKQTNAIARQIILNSLFMQKDILR